MAEYIEREALAAYADQKIKEGEAEMAICDKTDLDFCTGRTCGYMVMKNAFFIIPAADVEPVRHGRWVLDDYTKRYRCSVCEAYKPYDAVGDYIDYWDCDYCPKCGAKMDLEVSE